MKKAFILPALISLLSISTLVSCGDDPVSSQPAAGGVYHDHIYDGYEIEGDKHYQKCTYLNCTYETPHTTHVYDQEVYLPETFVSEATCEQAAQFYKSCVCGVISTTETFDYGTPLSHSSAGDYLTDATHHWKVCDCEVEHSKVEHDFVNKEDTVSCTVDGGKYQECNECGWTTPISQRENYIPAYGHDLDSSMTVASFPSNSNEGILTFKCKREGCKSNITVSLPLATEENYTFATSGSSINATLKAEAIAALAAKYTDIKDLSTRLTNHAFTTSAASVGYPYTFKINGKQVLPNVPSEQDTNNNHLSVVLALKNGDVLRIYKDQVLQSFVATEWGTITSGTSYKATGSSVMKLHISKDGGLYGERLSVLPYESYTIKVNGTSKPEALVEDSGNDFAKFEVELAEGDVVTFYGDNTALSGGVVANATEGYKALSSGTHTFYINNLNEVYVTAPELKEAVEITYYYYNNLGWEKVNCYSWADIGNSESTLSSGWPGNEMDPVADKEGWYTYTIELNIAATQINVIFNNGTDQTTDIEVTKDIKDIAEGYYFFGKSATVYSSFEEAEQAVADYVPPTVQTWGVVGSGFTSSDWNSDVWMSETETKGVYEATITSTKAIEFKIRKEGSWDVNYGGSLSNGKASGVANGDNIKLAAGTYKITFNDSTFEITVSPVTE